MTETLYSPRNDPDPEMIPNPEMIPKSTPKWFPFLFTSTPKFQFGVDLGILSGLGITGDHTKTAGRHNLGDSQPGVNLIKLLHV